MTRCLATSRQQREKGLAVFLLPLDVSDCTTDRIRMTTAAGGPTEIWQARIAREQAAQLRADAEILGLSGRTDIVKAALELLHRHAAEVSMAKSVDEFYGGATPPLPAGVAPDASEE
jgi:hypothetical protein